MKVGTVKEIKNQEYRVGLTPDNVKAYVADGHEVYVEKNAGSGSGFKDEDYLAAGAVIMDTAEEVWQTVDMMVKVKEPLEEEYKLVFDDEKVNGDKATVIFEKNGLKGSVELVKEEGKWKIFDWNDKVKEEAPAASQQK